MWCMSKYCHSIVLGMLLGLFTIAFMRTAWVAEDAYISFRVIENLLSGAGLVWNLGERVQVFTHPLWLFLLVPLVSLAHDPYWASLCLSYALLVFVVCVLFSIGKRSSWVTMAVLLVLLASRSFIDYSSSGLENPLVHALLVAYLWVYFRWREYRQRHVLLGVGFALLYLARPDAVVIVLPSMLLDLLTYIRHERRPPWFLLVGASLIVSWSVFALFYFGSAVPNTALAKLGTGLSLWGAITQARWGIQWVVEMDTLTLILITVGAGWALLSQNRGVRMFGLGVGLWFIYYFCAGGDYMGGRFFSSVTVVAAWLLIDCLCQSGVEASRVWCISLAIMLVVGLRPYHGFVLDFLDETASYEQIPGGLSATLLSPSDFRDYRIGAGGVADERGFYYRNLGMLPNLFERNLRERSEPALLGQEANRAGGIFLSCNIGVFGYYAKQQVTILDPFALADPFLARLPAREGARVGHYERALPKGYVETLLSSSNSIEDPSLAHLWGLVSQVTRGELFSLDRIRAIYELNLQGGDLVRSANYDRNDIQLLGSKGSARTMLSCLGQDKGPFIWAISKGIAGAETVQLASP